MAPSCRGPARSFSSTKAVTRATFDARIAAVVQGIVEHFVSMQISPDVFVGPTNKAVHLDWIKFRFPADGRCFGPSSGLVMADSCDPCVQLAQFKSLGAYLAYFAAFIWFSTPQALATRYGLLLNGEGWWCCSEHEFGSVFESSPETVGLRK